MTDGAGGGGGGGGGGGAMAAPPCDGSSSSSDSASEVAVAPTSNATLRPTPASTLAAALFESSSSRCFCARACLSDHVSPFFSEAPFCCATPTASRASV